MALSNRPDPRSIRGFDLDFPQSLAVYGEYADAQRAVDYLSDHQFPVQNCMIVGTDLKRIERITGRLTTGRVAAMGAGSGLWLGLFVGLIFSFFGSGNQVAMWLSSAVLGALFGTIWALVGLPGNPRSARLLLGERRGRHPL